MNRREAFAKAMGGIAGLVAMAISPKPDKPPLLVAHAFPPDDNPITAIGRQFYADRAPWPTRLPCVPVDGEDFEMGGIPHLGEDSRNAFYDSIKW